MLKGENKLAEIDLEVEPKNWLHPSKLVTVCESGNIKQSTVNIFTDGSKNKARVDSGIAIFVGEKFTQQFKFKLSCRCTNNQAEQLAIVKALDAIAGGVP
jgi:Ribonuclease HI